MSQCLREKPSSPFHQRLLEPGKWIFLLQTFALFAASKRQRPFSVRGRSSRTTQRHLSDIWSMRVKRRNMNGRSSAHITSRNRRSSSVPRPRHPCDPFPGCSNDPVRGSKNRRPGVKQTPRLQKTSARTSSTRGRSATMPHRHRDYFIAISGLATVTTSKNSHTAQPRHIPYNPEHWVLSVSFGDGSFRPKFGYLSSARMHPATMNRAMMPIRMVVGNAPPRYMNRFPFCFRPKNHMECSP